jgi:ABC-type molybdate transport system permease subunit
MEKIKNFIASRYKKLMSKKRYFVSLMLPAFLMLLTSMPAYAAGGISGSPIVTGTEKLIGDVTTWLMVLAPVVAGLLIIYFCIRRSAADEMDQKKWNTRIIAAIVSCIGAILGSATLNLIIGYYK